MTVAIPFVGLVITVTVTGPATATLPLAAFAGRQVRVRFSYKTAQTDQVREFAVRLVACGGAL